MKNGKNEKNGRKYWRGRNGNGNIITKRKNGKRGNKYCIRMIFINLSCGPICLNISRYWKIIVMIWKWKIRFYYHFFHAVIFLWVTPFSLLCADHQDNIHDWEIKQYTTVNQINWSVSLQTLIDGRQISLRNSFLDQHIAVKQQ